MKHRHVKKKPYTVKPVKEHTDRYLCVICGYVYDEGEHGVRFEDLPDDYRCPLCLAGKAYFEKI